MTCGIYKITNSVTGEFYIGQSTDVEARWQKHLKAFNRKCGGTGNTGALLFADAQEYGFDVYRFGILETCDRSERYTRELFWVRKLEPHLNGITYKNGAYHCPPLTASVKQKVRKVRR